MMVKNRLVKFCSFYSNWTTAADLMTALLGSALAIVIIVLLRKQMKNDLVLKAMFILVSLNIVTCLSNLKIRTRCMEIIPYGFPEGNVFFLLFLVMPLWLVGFGTAIWIIKRCSTNTKYGV